MVKKLVKRITNRVKKDNENGARQSVIEDLFYDFHRNRHQVYLMNFIRGIFFGLGSALGASVVIALILWLLSLFTDIPGGIGDFIQSIINEVNSTRPAV
ncbi:MAG: hypothetical protein JWO61_68 [Candidatus Saccharibacteria bacterium]|nr:hypothetical protein [Candidatus Saccharibacteria bacterium]